MEEAKGNSEMAYCKSDFFFLFLLLTAGIKKEHRNSQSILFIRKVKSRGLFI